MPTDAPPAATLAEAPASAPAPRPDAPDAAHLLKLRVPVIAQLAARSMKITDIRRLSPGAVIKFDKSVEAEIDLLIRNRAVGNGRVVRVGERFGLRITRIRDRATRIRSLGV